MVPKSGNRFSDKTMLTYLWFLTRPWRRTFIRLFDHVVGDAEKSGWDRQSQCLRGLQINCQFELRGVLDRKVRGLAAAQYLVHKHCRAAEVSGNAGAVGDQPAG